MARRYKLRDKEKEFGKPLEEIIPPLVNKQGQKYAANLLSVSQASISGWLTTNGYVKVTRWEKVQPT